MVTRSKIADIYNVSTDYVKRVFYLIESKDYHFCQEDSKDGSIKFIHNRFKIVQTYESLQEIVDREITTEQLAEYAYRADLITFNEYLSLSESIADDLDREMYIRMHSE